MVIQRPPQFHLTRAWLPTALLAGAGFLCGVAASAVFMLGVESERIEKLQNELVKSSARVDALQSAQSSLGLALALPAANLPNMGRDNPAAPPPPPPKATEPPPEAAAPVTPVTPPAAPLQPPAPPASKPPIAAVKAPAKPVAPVTPPSKSAAATAQKPPAAKEKPAEAKPAQTTRTAGMELPLPEGSPPPAGGKPSDTPKPSAPVGEGELKAAIDKNSIEMAPKTKMGVDKIESGLVIMASGSKVHVGDRFNSGERLLSVDPETGRIVTDRRTVMITP